MKPSNDTASSQGHRSPDWVPNLSVRKFYFLEYYYILLASIAKYEAVEQVFESFKQLKQEHYLGESRFRKLTVEFENLTPNQESRYRYTFQQVVEDAKEFGLIVENENCTLTMTIAGHSLLESFGTEKFYQVLLILMEQKGHAFKYLLDRMYKANTCKPGLLIFPAYSPNQLGICRSELKHTSDMLGYIRLLQQRLEADMKEHLGKTLSLSDPCDELIARLTKADVIPNTPPDDIDTRRYNTIVSRCRKFWLNYFLRDVYQYPLSLSSFDLWVYRGKQVGVLHVTESYPNFIGRLVYPTSVVTTGKDNPDFKVAFDYPDGSSLLLHEPKDERNISHFVDCLLEGYLSLRRTHRSYFINLLLLRELVCYNLKISETVFAALLEQAYQMNLKSNLKVRISLEVDKLPAETKAMYQKLDPVMVDGRYRNIIAIDVTSEANRHAK